MSGKFVQLSSASVYANDRKIKKQAASEEDDVAPWLESARFQLEAMASGGDERARVMLDELKRGDEGQVV